jgi:hypothetical protein
MSTQLNLVIRDFINGEPNQLSLNEKNSNTGLDNRISDHKTISNMSPKGAQVINDDWREHL